MSTTLRDRYLIEGVRGGAPAWHFGQSASAALPRARAIAFMFLPAESSPAHWREGAGRSVFSAPAFGTQRQMRKGAGTRYR